jgi:MinD superfamily P-loop ATPase
MIHAKLGPAEENSGKLVSLIRKEAKRIATEQSKDLIIVDGSPGIGCPVIASITAADLVLAVTEPSLSAQHDLQRVISLAEHFNIPTVVCINKYDINVDIAKDIENEAQKNNLKLVGKITYDTAVTKAQIEAKTIVEYSNDGLKKQVVSLWESVLDILEQSKNTRETNNGK